MAAHPPLTSNDALVAVYRPPPGSVVRDIADEAYKQAIGYFKLEFAGDKKTLDFLTGHNSIVDIEAVVDQAKTKYEVRSKSRRPVLQWLNAVSLRVRYYSKALDMLAQHHPEYTSLAWGALKLVLAGIINHEELLEELAKALTLISDVLPGTKVSMDLYQTDQMRDAVGRLYAQIMLFFQQAVRWYSKGPAGRVISSIFNPFELRYQDTITQIKACASMIENIASNAARAEIRDIHVMLQLTHRSHESMSQKIQIMQKQLDAMESDSRDRINQILDVLFVNNAITEKVHYNTSEMMPRILDIQLSQIIAGLTPQISSEDLLKKQQSLVARRHRSWRDSLQTPTHVVKLLGKWVEAPGSSMFVLRSGSRAKALASGHAVNIINYLRGTQYKVFWNLSNSGVTEPRPTTISMLQALVFQVITNNPDVLLRFPETVNGLRFLANHTENEWWDLLSTLLSRLDKCFLIVEMDDLYQAVNRDSDWNLSILGAFQEFVDKVDSSGAKVKALIVSFGPELPEKNSGATSRFVTTIQHTPPSRRGKLLKRGFSRKFGRGFP